MNAKKQSERFCEKHLREIALVFKEGKHYYLENEELQKCKDCDLKGIYDLRYEYDYTYDRRTCKIISVSDGYGKKVRNKAIKINDLVEGTWELCPRRSTYNWKQHLTKEEKETISSKIDCGDCLFCSTKFKANCYISSSSSDEEFSNKGKRWSKKEENHLFRKAIRFNEYSEWSDLSDKLGRTIYALQLRFMKLCDDAGKNPDDYGICDDTAEFFDKVKYKYK